MTTKLDEVLNEIYEGYPYDFMLTEAEAKQAIQAWHDTEIAKAKKRELEKIKEVASDNDWDAVILAGYIDGGLKTLTALADTESKKEK